MINSRERGSLDTQGILTPNLVIKAPIIEPYYRSLEEPFKDLCKGSLL